MKKLKKLIGKLDEELSPSDISFSVTFSKVRAGGATPATRWQPEEPAGFSGQYVAKSEDSAIEYVAKGEYISDETGDDDAGAYRWTADGVPLDIDKVPPYVVAALYKSVVSASEDWEDDSPDPPDRDDRYEDKGSLRNLEKLVRFENTDATPKQMAGVLRQLADDLETIDPNMMYGDDAKEVYSNAVSEAHVLRLWAKGHLSMISTEDCAFDDDKSEGRMQSLNPKWDDQKHKAVYDAVNSIWTGLRDKAQKMDPHSAKGYAYQAAQDAVQNLLDKLPAKGQMSEWAGEKMARDIERTTAKIEQRLMKAYKKAKGFARSPEADSIKNDLSAAIRELDAIASIANDAAWFEYREEDYSKTGKAMSMIKKLNRMISTTRSTLSKAVRSASILAKKLPEAGEIAEIAGAAVKELDGLMTQVFGDPRHAYKESLSNLDGMLEKLRED